MKSSFLTLAAVLGIAVLGNTGAYAAGAAAPTQPAGLETSVSFSAPTSKYYSEATITVTNNTSAPVNLDQASVSFDVNSNNIGSMWAQMPIQASSFTYTPDANGYNVSFTLSSTDKSNSSPTTIAVGASTQLNFSVNLNGTPIQLSNIQVIPQGVTPQYGALVININPAQGMAKQNLGTENINIVANGNIIEQVSNSNWSNPSPITVNHLAYGQYTIEPAAIGNYTASSQPSTITVGATAASTTIQYAAKVVNGSVIVQLPQAPISNISNTVAVTLNDATTHQSQTQKINWNQNASFNVPAGDLVTVGLPTFANSTEIAVPSTNNMKPIKVNAGQSVPVSPTFQISNRNPVALNFDVSGLNSNTSSISLIDKYGTVFSFTLNNGKNPEQLPENDSFTIQSVTAPNGYDATYPKNTINTGGAVNPNNASIDISFSPLPQANGLLVGYLDLSASNDTTIEDGVDHGYNIIVVGWGQVVGDTASVYPATLANAPNLAKDISYAHSKGAKVLLSFGGANNTFNPPLSQSPSEDAKYAQDIATQIVNLAKQYGFDGFDFDLENVDAGQNNYDIGFVEDLINDIKSSDPKLLITGAPQISAYIAQGTGFIGLAPVHGNNRTDIVSWNDLVNANLFDYIFIQAYNQYGGAQFYGNTAAGKSVVIEDTDPAFISGSYDLLMNSSYSQVDFNDLKTKLILGVPSTTNSTSGGSGVSDPNLIKQQFNCIETGNSCSPEYAPSKTYQPAGLMTWSIEGDAQVNWNFSNGTANLAACILHGQCQ